MKVLKLLVLSGSVAFVLALTGCGDRAMDPGAGRTQQQTDDLRDRIRRVQSER
jgi:hypothetical protein